MKKSDDIEVKGFHFKVQSQDYLASVIGVTTYNELVQSCLEWSRCILPKQIDIETIHDKKKAISDSFNNDYFQKIIKIHKQIQDIEGDSSKGITPLLVDIVQKRHFEFLIAYMYFTHELLEGTKGIEFGLLGSVEEVLEVIDLIGDVTEV